MRNFLKTLFASMFGFLLGLALLVLIVVAIISGAASSGNVNVEEHTVLELKLNGEIPERDPSDNPFAGFTGPAGVELSGNVGLNGIIKGLQRAAADERIKGILIRPDLYAGGLATAEEIHNQILKFRKSGKFAYAYGEAYTDGGYYIASACDMVFLNPKGVIEFNGFSGRVTFFKGLLDKAGVEFEVFKAGKFKGAVEPFVQQSLSEPNREQIREYVNQLFGYHVSGIAKNRKSDSGTMAGIANGFLARNAKTALQYNLVDGLKYEDEVEALIRGKAGIKEDRKFKTLAFSNYLKSKFKEKYYSDKIAVIYGLGDINPGKNENGDGIGSETMAAAIRKARLDKNIKAVVFRVNSPGGSSNASDIIAREIELCRKVKPVIVSFGDVAASGGYYISCMADSIFAYPNSVTGSIGVFALIPNTSKLYKQHLGLTYETVPTGEFAAGWRPDEPMTDGMKTYVQETVNDIYGDFVGIVSRGRKIDSGRVLELAEGRVYTAMKAKELGLIDGFGGIDRALSSAAAKAGIKEYRIVEYPAQKTAFELLFGDPSTDAMTDFLKTNFGTAYESAVMLKNLQNMQGPQMLMPWSIQIR